MEGAVRSGYAAAQCVARVAGQRKAAFLVPDLAAKGFMRIFGERVSQVVKSAVNNICFRIARHQSLLYLLVFAHNRAYAL